MASDLSDKPITGEWLDSLGGELLDEDDNDWTFVFRIRGDSRVRLYVWSDLTITFGDTDYRPKCGTRGKFLKLCEALDVITTEQPHA